MILFSPRRLPRDPEGRDRRRDGRLLVRVAEAQLRDPALRHQVDVAALDVLCRDDRQTTRTRRRAAELSLVAQLRALGALASHNRPLEPRARRE